MTWRDDAACRGVDTNLFYPDRGAPSVYSRPLAYCKRCPVLAECRAEADKHEAEAMRTDGVWGGETPEMRKARRTKRRPAA
jgi:WhiB family transcriptional regulator, redox-sensing transcriptional regulator